MADMAERAGIAWRRMERSNIRENRPRVTAGPFVCSSPAHRNIREVVIRWNSVLEAAVEMIAGTEPAYTRERDNGLIQTHVRFRIPIDNNRNIYEHVEASGKRCLEVWEADSTAAARALDRLEREPFYIKILDISRLRCEEMEQSCNRNLLKAGEMYRAGRLLLLDWEDAMVRTEACYKELYMEVVDNMRCGTDSIYGEIPFDMANCIYKSNSASYLKLSGLASEVENVKAAEWDVRERSHHHFRGQYHSRPRIHQGCLPHELRVCMKIVLDEMIRFLQLDEPAFKFSPTEGDLYSCEVILLLKRNNPGVCVKTPAFAVGKGASHHEALENACQHAVFLLEDEMSVHLVDMNYNRRLHAEPYVAEAKEVANLAVSIHTKILTEWEILVDGIHTCKKRCCDAVTEHVEKEPWNQQYNVKCECARALSDLHGLCQSELTLAKNRCALLNKWIVGQDQ